MFNLLKINLLTFFDFYKILNARSKDEYRKAILKFLFIIFGLVAMSYYVYFYLKQSMEGYMQLKIPYILLAQVFAIVSSFTFFTGIYKVNGVLFGFKDYDLLMSLPIKKSKIIISKISILYISNMIYILLFMIPTYILYINNVNIDFKFNLLFFITLFIIPILPIILSTIIGSIIIMLSNKFKLKKLMNLILTLIFTMLITYLSYKLQNAPTIDLANMGQSMVNIFDKIYPLTSYYVDIIKDYNISSLLIFTFVPIFLFIMYIIIIEKKFVEINNSLNKQQTKKNYKIKDLKTNNIIIALYKKEIKRYFNSVPYVFNTSVGALLLTVSIIALVFFGKGKIDAILGINGLSDMFIKNGPIMLASFCLLNCSTHPSISLEGKNIWIMKSIPVKPMSIFISKIMVNLTILVPTIFINATILSIYLNTSIKTYLLCLILPLLYSIFISILGIIINCFFINYNYKTEIQVIKQSAPAFITIILGMLLAILPFNLDIDINKYIYLIILIVLLLDIILYIFMKKISTKQFKNS